MEKAYVVINNAISEAAAKKITKTLSKDYTDIKARYNLQEEKLPEYWEMVARVEKLAIHAHDAGRRGEPVPNYLGQQAAHIVNSLLAVAMQIKNREAKQ